MRCVQFDGSGWRRVHEVLLMAVRRGSWGHAGPWAALPYRHRLASHEPDKRLASLLDLQRRDAGLGALNGSLGRR